MGNFKLQSWNTKFEKWLEPNLKSLGFIWKRIANLLGVFRNVLLYDIKFTWFLWCCFWSHLFSTVSFVVDRVAKLVLFVSVAESDDSPAPTLRSSLLSPLLSSPLVLGNSLFLILVEQMVASFHLSALLVCSPNL